jgi:hypothetical protein
MKFVMTPTTDRACARCGETRHGLELSFFTKEHMDRSGPICLVCLAGNEEIVGNLLLADVAEKESRKKLLRQQKTMSKKQELEIAEALGARTQKASGALAGSKGDGRKKGVLRFEAKYTLHDSFPLKLEDLYKIASECHGAERPLLVLDFKDRATGRLRDRFAVLHFDDAKEMFDAGHDR